MVRVFDGRLPVHYGQAYLHAEDEDFPDMTEAFHGQANGLCGAAVPGCLFLITGLHTGEVGLTVDVLDVPPPLDDRCEDVVEVSLTVAGPDLVLEDWHGGTYPIPLPPGDYRVRYCGRRMDEGNLRDTTLSGDDPIDHYALAFWPAPPAPERVVRRTSQVAAYWHDTAWRQPT